MMLRQKYEKKNDHFECHGCGASVYRLGRARAMRKAARGARLTEDELSCVDFKCLNCWSSKPWGGGEVEKRRRTYELAAQQAEQKTQNSKAHSRRR